MTGRPSDRPSRLRDRLAELRGVLFAFEIASRNVTASLRRFLTAAHTPPRDPNEKRDNRD